MLSILLIALPLPLALLVMMLLRRLLLLLLLLWYQGFFLLILLRLLDEHFHVTVHGGLFGVVFFLCPRPVVLVTAVVVMAVMVPARCCAGIHYAYYAYDVVVC